MSDLVAKESKEFQEEYKKYQFLCSLCAHFDDMQQYSSFYNDRTHPHVKRMWACFKAAKKAWCDSMDKLNKLSKDHDWFDEDEIKSYRTNSDPWEWEFYLNDKGEIEDE